ncbi:hypothetical protein Y032_0255g339 [Ancylostoma ceylanicum]|uniref:Uncharacterized protein n=1 Tax=Ancylostoma ceylanicum TaxID=53326 RepID=A0A016SBB6_9BILA|nr:hypothetical protein Y032_0255g339 [Ancylostoma ceylanicum]
MRSVRSRDAKSIISFFKGLCEEVWPSGRWSSCRALYVPRSPVADGSRPMVVILAHHVSGPPDLTQLGVHGSVPDLRLLTKGGTPYSRPHLSEAD